MSENNQLITKQEKILLPMGFILIIAATIISESPARILLLIGALIVCIMKVLTLMMCANAANICETEDELSSVYRRVRIIRMAAYVLCGVLIAAGLIWMCFLP